MSIGSFSEVKKNSGMLHIQASAEDLKAFADLAILVAKAAAKAQRRAINKTLGWLRGKIASNVGKQEKIAVRAVRQRLITYPVKGGAMRGKLWFGINPLEASRAGRAQQTQAGVSVAGRRYKGAFYKKVYGNQAEVWIRTASKHFDASDYPESQVSGGGKQHGWVSENSSRFPLAKAKISLEDIRPHFESWVGRVHQRLLEILEQELNYELQKYLRSSGSGR